MLLEIVYEIQSGGIKEPANMQQLLSVSYLLIMNILSEIMDQTEQPNDHDLVATEYPITLSSSSTSTIIISEKSYHPLLSFPLYITGKKLSITTIVEIEHFMSFCRELA